MRASPSLFTLSAPFAGPANAVIVTPTPLKADVVNNAGVVLTPRLGRVCFHPPVSSSLFPFASYDTVDFNRMPIENETKK